MIAETMTLFHGHFVVSHDLNDSKIKRVSETETTGSEADIHLSHDSFRNLVQGLTQRRSVKTPTPYLKKRLHPRSSCQLKCDHGTLNATTCKCKCPSRLYTGPTCGIKQCPHMEIWITHCGYTTGYTVADCTRYSNIKYMCPYMCGMCKESERPTCAEDKFCYESPFGCKYLGVQKTREQCKSLGDSGKDFPTCQNKAVKGKWSCGDCRKWTNVGPQYCPYMCGLCKSDATDSCLLAREITTMENSGSPACVDIGGLCQGRRVTVTGSVCNNPTRFTVDFKTAAGGRPLQFDVRFAYGGFRNTIVLNHMANNVFQAEKHIRFRFGRGKYYKFTFTVDGNKFKIREGGLVLGTYTLANMFSWDNVNTLCLVSLNNCMKNNKVSLSNV